MASGLIKPKVKVTSLKSKAGKALFEAVERSRGSYVTVGIQQPDLAYPNGATLGQVAAWQEFGTHSAKGDEIIPERSFIRATIDNKAAAIEKVKDTALKALVAGRSDLRHALTTIGFRVVEMMRDTIMRKQTVGNDALEPATLARKRALGQPDTPLVATRLLIDHIGHHVVIAEGAEAANDDHHGGH